MIKLLELINKAKNNNSTKELNLEKALEIVIRLLSSLEDSKKDIGKEALQSFYLLTIKRISKVLYCNDDGIYNALIKDINLVKFTWQELEDK